MCLITDTDPKTDSGRCDGYVMSYVRVQLVSFPVLIYWRHVFELTKVQWDKYDGLPCCFPTILVLMWRCFGSLPLWCASLRDLSAEPLLIHWQTSSAISSSLQIILPHGYSYKVSCARPDYAVICNFWHPGTLTRQCARMSKITNDVGLQLNSVWHRMLYTCSCTHMATVGVKVLGNRSVTTENERSRAAPLSVLAVSIKLSFGVTLLQLQIGPSVWDLLSWSIVQYESYLVTRRKVHWCSSPLVWYRFMNFLFAFTAPFSQV